MASLTNYIIIGISMPITESVIWCNSFGYLYFLFYLFDELGLSTEIFPDMAFSPFPSSFGRDSNPQHLVTNYLTFTKSISIQTFLFSNFELRISRLFWIGIVRRRREKTILCNNIESVRGIPIFFALAQTQGIRSLSLQMTWSAIGNLNWKRTDCRWKKV